MNERTNELALEAGFSLRANDICVRHSNGSFVLIEKELERFAELIRADERDKCAQDYLQDCADAVEAARLEEREQISHTYLKLTVDAVLREREACSDLIANMISGIEGVRYAEAIRQRGKK